MSRLILVMGPYMYTLSAARYARLLQELLSCFILGTTWCWSTTGWVPAQMVLCQHLGVPDI